MDASFTSASTVALGETETHQRVGARESRFLLQTYQRSPITIDRGEGCVFWDIEGRRYLDFITGIGVNALGHAHPRLVRTIQAQAALCLHTSNLFYHRYQGLLAERLVEWSGLARVFFSNSGTEAVETALKAARAAGNRHQPSRRKIVALHHGFHGRTMGALSVTGHEKYRRLFEPLVPGVEFIAANDRDALRRAVDRETAAVILEVVQGEGGIHPLSHAFVADVRTLTERAGAMWIADETQCGLGRTGTRFAYQRFEDVGLPDIVVTAKPLAGGLPLGATIFSEAAAAAIPSGMHGTTFGGGPLACRVAIEVLSMVDELLPHIRAAGAHLHERLRGLAGRHRVVTEVRGAGVMAGLQLSVPGDRYVDACLRRGLAINCTHDTVLRLLPPLIVSTSEIDEAISILDAALAE
ncbi:MAG: acetylornithine/succinylornithine family transaminase [Acidobacteriota bacterium]